MIFTSSPLIFGKTFECRKDFRGFGSLHASALQIQQLEQERTFFRDKRHKKELEIFPFSPRSCSLDFQGPSKIGDS
jgi:hypothetical protein